MSWSDWDEEFREKQGKRKNRTKLLVNALAKRIVRQPELFEEIAHLLAPQKYTAALHPFGEQLGQCDKKRELLFSLLDKARDSKHWDCLQGYLGAVRDLNLSEFRGVIQGLLLNQSDAWLGASLALRSEYDDGLFGYCLMALEAGRIESAQFLALNWAHAWQAVPTTRIKQLIEYLYKQNSEASNHVLMDVLKGPPFNAAFQMDANTVFETITRTIPGENGWSIVRGYDWEIVCKKLIQWDSKYSLPLLDALLTNMEDNYRLTYDSYVEPVASELLKLNPTGSWQIIIRHFETSLSMRHSYLTQWLKGGHTGFGRSKARCPIADIPASDILAWIGCDPLNRAGLIALAAPRTLDDEHGGNLTREILTRYSDIDDVQSSISATFHSGSWTGLESAYLKRSREVFRVWLSAGFGDKVNAWIEHELDYFDQRIAQAEISEERSHFV